MKSNVKFGENRLVSKYSSIWLADPEKLFQFIKTVMDHPEYEDIALGNFLDLWKA